MEDATIKREEDITLQSEALFAIVRALNCTFVQNGVPLEGDVAMTSRTLVESLLKFATFNSGGDGTLRAAKRNGVDVTLPVIYLGIGLHYTVESAELDASASEMRGRPEIDVNALIARCNQIESVEGDIPIDAALVDAIAAVAERHLSRQSILGME